MHRVCNGSSRNSTAVTVTVLAVFQFVAIILKGVDECVFTPTGSWYVHCIDLVDKQVPLCNAGLRLSVGLLVC